MKIAHVLPTRSPSYGGPVAVASQLAGVAAAEGHEACILPERVVSPVKLGGTLVYRLTHADLDRLRSCVDEADIVHVHGLWNLPCTIACRLARSASTPYIVTPHGMLTRWSLEQSRRKKLLYGLLVERGNLSGAAAIHFLNDTEREEGRGYSVATPTFVLANGVDEELLRLERSRLGMEALVPAVRDRTVILFLGRLHHKKGIDRLLAAFADARRSNDDLHLLIAGPDEGGYQSVVCRLIRRFGVGSSVTLLGEVHGTRKSALLSGADIFALISREEGDPVAVKEAMAAGIPVVITDQCRLPEVGTSGAGLVVEPEVDSVSRALVSLAGNARRRAAAGSAGRRQVSEHYQSAEIGRLMLAAYDRFGSASDTGRSTS